MTYYLALNNISSKAFIFAIMNAQSTKTINKVVCVGLSKTGTTTLDLCLSFLGFGPSLGYHGDLTAEVKKGSTTRAMECVQNAQYLQDSPWFLLFREIDEAYENCKFILTLRKDSDTHAISNWSHALRKGQRVESEKEEVLRITKERYESHNQAVREYFKNRPDDLLEVCWENQDCWEKLCPFLHCPIPLIRFPHSNSKPASVNIFSPILKLPRRRRIYLMRMRSTETLLRAIKAVRPNSIADKKK